MIPTIDLAAIESLDEEAIEALRQATHGIGAVSIEVTSTCPPAFPDDVFEQAAAFFACTDDVKHAVDLASSPNCRGYVGLREEHTNGIPDLKESFEFATEIPLPAPDPAAPWLCLYGENLWPAAPELHRFEPVMHAFSDWMSRVGSSLRDAFVCSMGQAIGPESTSGLFEHPVCCYSRLIHYSDPRVVGAGGESADTRLAAHTDHGLFTITVESAAGLEIELGSGEWVLAQPSPMSLLVFVGDLMELWTRGYYPALRHRVRNGALAGPRLSIATFIEADLRSRVIPLEPASSSHLSGADLALSPDNYWLDAATESEASNEDRELAPVQVGAREWARMQAIFPALDGS